MGRHFLVIRILQPHWKALLVAFAAVVVESVADLIGPWPVKIVLDYVIGSREPPAWLESIARLAPEHGQAPGVPTRRTRHYLGGPSGAPRQMGRAPSGRGTHLYAGG